MLQILRSLENVLLGYITIKFSAYFNIAISGKMGPIVDQ